MQAEFTRYIRRWKADRSTGNEILHKMISRELWENFTMHGKGKGERKQAFMFTKTFEVILNELTCCKDSQAVRKRKSVSIFLRNKKYEGKHWGPGSKRRKTKNNDDL